MRRKTLHNGNIPAITHGLRVWIRRPHLRDLSTLTIIAQKVVSIFRRHTSLCIPRNINKHAANLVFHRPCRKFALVNTPHRIDEERILVARTVIIEALAICRRDGSRKKAWLTRNSRAPHKPREEFVKYRVIAAQHRCHQQRTSMQDAIFHPCIPPRGYRFVLGNLIWTRQIPRGISVRTMFVNEPRAVGIKLSQNTPPRDIKRLFIGGAMSLNRRFYAL